MESTPTVVETPVTDGSKVEANAKPSPAEMKPSPAQDLRDIQALLANGIFPGNVAPAIVKAYQLIERMAQKVELDAKGA